MTAYINIYLHNDNPAQVNGNAYYHGESTSASGPLASTADNLVSWMLQRHEAAQVVPEGGPAYTSEPSAPLGDAPDSEAEPALLTQTDDSEA